MKTFQEVRNILSAIEPDEGIYSLITPEDIPHLQMLMKDSEAWLSARAIFALSRLKDDKAYSLIDEATKDKRSEVRIAIAVASPLLPVSLGEKLLSKLLTDEDFGVKQYAIHSVSGNPNKEIKTQLQKLSLYDSSDYIKNISKDKLSKSNPLP